MARRLLFTWTLFIICSSFVLGNSNQNDDILEFLNVKETYCYETKTTLTISIPKSVPANTKFKVSLQSLYGSLFLGSTTQSTIEVQLPAHFGGEYFVVESEDGQYRATSRRINIIGGAKPLIIAMTGSSKTSSAEVTHCDGYSTKLFSDTFGHYYQWRKDGLNINGANNREFDAIESGDYSVSVSRNGCSAESNIIRVKLGSIPNAAIKSITGFQSICKGFTVPMLETTGFGYDKYVWKHNGRIVAEKTTNEIFEARETGYYLLEASQGTCKKVTDSIYISISDLSKSLISVYNPNLDKGKIYVCDSSSTNFYNGSLGVYNYNSEDITQFLKKYGLNFQWKRNGMDISDAKNPYTLTSNKPGKYVLQVKQGECIVNSNQIEVVLQEKVAVKLLSSSYGSLNEKKNSVSVCIGDSLSIYPDSKVLLNSWNKYLYRDGKLIESRTMVDGNNFGLYFSIYESGAYYLKLSSSLQENCSSISDTINIEVANKIITLPVDTFAVCKNVLYTFSFIDADSLKLMYNNKVISYNPPTIILDLPGLYALEGKKNNGCTIIKPYLKEEKIKPYVTSKRFYSLPFPDPVTNCKGNEVNLAIAGLYGPYTLEWYNNDKKLAFNNYSINVTESGNYFAKVKYMDCEATTNAIKVDMVDIKKTISPTDSLALCINGGFETLEASKENGYTYEWFKDNTSLEETASSLKVTQTGIYIALIQAGDCSALTSSVKVYPGTQLPTATISGDTLLNVGDTANLKLAFTSNPPFTYKLSNNQEGTSQTNTIIHPVKVEEASVFQLASVKNACGEGTVSGEAKIQVIILANEPLIGHKVVVAPVPAESYCEIIFDLPTSQEVSYQLLDVKGQKLSEKNLGQVTYKKQYLNLNHLTAGEYLIRIHIGKDFVTRKLIKF